MLRIGTKVFDIVIASGNAVILRETEHHTSICLRDLWAVDLRTLTPEAQAIVESWKEVAYHD